MQLMEEINHDQTRELEHMIRELESENATLQEEYAHLKATTTSSSSSGTTTSGVSVSTFTSGAAISSAAASDVSSKANDILTEAKLLREHKERLESRMKVLEEHNQQLVSQLGKLKHYICPKDGASSLTGDGLSSTGANKTGTLNMKSVTASQLAQVIQCLSDSVTCHSTRPYLRTSFDPLGPAISESIRQLQHNQGLLPQGKRATFPSGLGILLAFPGHCRSLLVFVAC